MRLTITRLCLALAISFVAQVGHAATLGIVIDASETGKKCGITEAMIEGRAKVVLRAVGITVDPKEAHAKSDLYVNTSFVTPLPNLCVSSIRVQVQTYIGVPAGADFTPAKNGSAFYVACESGEVLSADKSKFENEFLDELERLTKDCLGKVDYKQVREGALRDAGR